MEFLLCPGEGITGDMKQTLLTSMSPSIHPLSEGRAKNASLNTVAYSCFFVVVETKEIANAADIKSIKSRLPVITAVSCTELD